MKLNMTVIKVAAVSGMTAAMVVGCSTPTIPVTMNVAGEVKLTGVNKIAIADFNSLPSDPFTGTMAADEEADAGTRARARSELLTLTSRMEVETTVEGVLRMRGFEDAVVTVSANSVNVVVRADALSQTESAAILELVMRETGQSGANVKIMTVPR